MALKKRVLNALKAAARSMLVWLPLQNLWVFQGVLRGRRLPKSFAVAHLSFLLGTYESFLVRTIMAIPGRIEVAYDIGAHVGFLSLVLRERIGREGTVIAFEPARENASDLRSLVELNSLDNVVVIEAAVADSDGDSKLFHWNSSSMGVLRGAVDRQLVNDADYETVATVSLDTFVLKGNHAPPDLVKIDVEGAEGLVIRGGLEVIKRFRPLLLIELHGPENAARVWDLLESVDYRWVHISAVRSELTRVAGRGDLLAKFGSGDAWTQHVLLTSAVRGSGRGENLPGT